MAAASNRGGVASDDPINTKAKMYSPRGTYSIGDLIYHGKWGAEGKVIGFAPPRETLMPFPQNIHFRDFNGSAGSAGVPVFMDVQFEAAVGKDAKPGVKTLLCSIPTEDIGDFQVGGRSNRGGIETDPGSAKTTRGGIETDSGRVQPDRGGVQLD